MASLQAMLGAVVPDWFWRHKRRRIDANSTSWATDFLYHCIRAQRERQTWLAEYRASQHGHIAIASATSPLLRCFAPHSATVIVCEMA